MAKLALLLLLAGASVAAADKMGIWSPLYYKINPSTGDEYTNFINTVAANPCFDLSFQGAILTGPTSRPPPLKDVASPGQGARSDNYQARFDVVNGAKGWQGFGYIFTDYGNRKMADIQEDVTRWCDPVNGYRKSVRGIFLDQVAPSLDCSNNKKNDVCLLDFYQKVVDLIKAQCTTPEDGTPMIMLNPGRSFAECDFMAKNNIAFVNAWEDTYATYQKFSAAKLIDCPCKDKGVRCVASIHSVPTDADVAAVMKDMADKGFSAIFMTENKKPNHYESVPTIWPKLAAAACEAQAYQPKRLRAQRRMLEA